MSGDIDETIRKALGGEDLPRDYDLSDDESVFHQAIGVMRGRRAWINWVAGFMTFLIFGVSVWSAVMFFGAESTRDQIMWATIFVVTQLGVALLKMWFWMQMNKNALKREVKRLELQVAVLSERLAR